RQLKAQQQKGPASQELTALKTENADAELLPADGKEKAAFGEEQTESRRLLQGQEEERLRDANRAGTTSIAQDVNIQVEKGKDLELTEQFDALRREHTVTLQELQRAHEQEKLLLAESHHRTQAALQETIQTLNSQLKSFQERMKRVEESLLSTDYKKHIQEHGSPSPFWEQELESLHFVIEMKNEHIPGLDKKLLKRVVGSKGGLQRVPFARRQLSEELLAARGMLEKEAQRGEQAQREKEELMYRLLNGGDGIPFPIPAGEVSLIAT
ncbi:PREDICTED: coiled-coil domain-containing protein 69, partial [Eurypyga helias]|uniref:coiled-coil domain-containing protein 69 n=1 Tax=Eurypyga helias TaxID=54383 RepID=UPI0005292D89